MSRHLLWTIVLAALMPVLAGGAEGILTTDIVYATRDGAELALDVWVPAGDGPFAAVVIVHGGGWEAGDKQTYVPPLFPPLEEAGFVWFSIDYRLAPEHRFPACTDDAAAAVQWVREHATDYKVDPERIALMGESAGGHIVSYVGARETAKGIAAVVSFYGLHDLLRWERERGEIGHHMRQLLGLTELNAAAERVLVEASPVHYVRAGMPPYLLVHGTADTGVPINQSETMCAAMREAGASCELYRVEGGGHGVGNWEQRPELHAYKSKMVEWLRLTLAR